MRDSFHGFARDTVDDLAIADRGHGGHKSCFPAYPMATEKHTAAALHPAPSALEPERSACFKRRKTPEIRRAAALPERRRFT